MLYGQRWFYYTSGWTESFRRRDGEPVQAEVLLKIKLCRSQIDCEYKGIPLNPDKS